MRFQTFISYSHRDQEWCDRLLVHLSPYTRQKTNLALWSDHQIRPGTLWRTEIADAIAQAQVAILLVSPDFLASDFIVQQELPPLLGAAEREGLKILWVPVSYSAYSETPIAEYQAVAEPAKPLKSLSQAEQDRVLVEMGHQLKAVTWSLSVHLSEPFKSHGIRSGHQLSIRGYVHFRPRGTSSTLTDGSSVRAALRREGIQIVPFVLSRKSEWWPQGGLEIQDDGTFLGTVCIGDNQGRSVGHDFEVVVCAVSHDTVVWNKPLTKLPDARIESVRVTVTRD